MKKTLRDHIAIELLKAEHSVWLSELSDSHRNRIIHSYEKSHPGVSFNMAKAKECYNLADAMIVARKDKKHWYRFLKQKQDDKD